jgi:autotransporter-associated beta strand protein
MKTKSNPFLRLAIAPATWLFALGLAHAQGPYTLHFDLNGTTAGSGVTANSNTVWWSALQNINQWAIGDGSGTAVTTNVNATVDSVANALSFNNPSSTTRVKSVVFSAGNDLSGINYLVRTETRNYFVQDLTVSSGNLTLEQSGSQIAFGVASNPTITVHNGASFANTSKDLNMNGRNVTMDIQGTATASTTGMRGSTAATSALIKNGTGSFSINGPSSYNGSTTVNGGTLKITDAQGLSFGAAVDLNVTQGAVTVTPGTGMTSATLDLSGNATFNKPITLDGTAVGGNSASLINSTAETTTVLDSGVSHVRFTNRGTGFTLDDLSTSPLSLSGGGTGATASIGVLQTWLGSFSLTDGGSGYTVGNDITINGGGATQTVIYRVLTVDGTGKILTVQHQRSGIGYTSSWGLSFSGGSGTGVEFTFNDNFAVNSIRMTEAGTGYTSAPTFTSSSGASFVGTAAISSLSLTGTNNQIGGDGNLVINTAIGQTAPGAGFAKIGTGTLVISGTNSYTGTSTVKAGTLDITGSLASGSSVTVGGSGNTGTPTLTGTGTVGGSLAIAAAGSGAAGTVNPGSIGGIGTLSTGATTIAGTYACDLNATTSDVLAVTGTLNLTGSTLAVNALATPVATTYTIATSTNGVSGSFTGLPEGATLTISGVSYTISYAAAGGNQVILTKAASSGYTGWANANGATGQTVDQDHDNDGVKNGIEYFMGESGNTFTSTPALNASNVITWTMGDAYNGVYGTDYRVQTSSDLTIWEPVAVGDVTIDNTAPGKSLTYTLTGSGKRFVRLVVNPN